MCFGVLSSSPYLSPPLSLSVPPCKGGGALLLSRSDWIRVGKTNKAPGGFSEKHAVGCLQKGPL